MILRDEKKNKKMRTAYFHTHKIVFYSNSISFLNGTVKKSRRWKKKSEDEKKNCRK